MHPPGISHGAFKLRIDNVWFCKLLLLFKIDTKTDSGMKKIDCAFVSVMKGYNSHSRPGTADILHIAYILQILHILYIMRILYFVKNQILFSIPVTVSSRLGRHRLVPVGINRDNAICHLRCEGNLLNFLALPVTKHRTLGTDAGGGMSIAWPFHRQRSNRGIPFSYFRSLNPPKVLDVSSVTTILRRTKKFEIFGIQ